MEPEISLSKSLKLESLLIKTLTFEDRCPLGFTKLELLGKRGTSLVWHGVRNGDHFAIKQFPKTDGKHDATAVRELSCCFKVFANSTNGMITALVEIIEDS